MPIYVCGDTVPEADHKAWDNVEYPKAAEEDHEAVEVASYRS